MYKYTIFCTEEQTKKALELGAPLHIIEATTETQIRAINTIANGRHKEEYTLVDNSLINNPTAEQMIRWLEEQELSFDTEWSWNGLFTIWVWDNTEKGRVYTSYDNSRKEATLAAIDAALEYLSKNK